MVSLKEILEKFQARFDDLPEDVRYIPEDGVCDKCHSLKAGHAGVERVLRARGMLWYDEENGRDVSTVPVPRCQCDAKMLRRAEAVEYAANLPLSVQGPRPRSFIAGSFTNFIERSGAEEAFEACMDFVNETTPPILVLRGPRGTGKTHLMESVGRELLAYGKTVRYERVPSLLSNIRSSYERAFPEDAEDAMRRCFLAELLMLDDLGAEKPSDWVREKLFELIDDRYSVGRLLIIATNESYTSLEANLGERIASRLFDTNSGKVMQVNMTCSDYRRA